MGKSSKFKSTLELQYPRTYQYESQENVELRKQLNIDKHINKTVGKMPNKRKCKHCGTFTREFVVYPVGVFCDHDHAVRYSADKSNQQRAKRQHQAQQRKKTAEAKKRLRTRSWYVNKAQTAFNAYIRERDKGRECISCQTTDANLQYHAGHYKTTKAYPELRFEPLNCHLQCSVCNNHLSGNLIEYRKNLIKRIGQDKVDWLEGHHELKKHTKEELLETAEYYKMLKKQIMVE